MAGCAQGLSNDILTKMGVYAFSNSCNRYTLDETINIGTEDSEYSFNISFSSDMLVDIKFLVGKINDDTQDIEHTITLSNISCK